MLGAWTSPGVDSQYFLRGNTVGNLWAVKYNANKELVFDAGFNRGLTSSSTRGKSFPDLPVYCPTKFSDIEQQRAYLTLRGSSTLPASSPSD